MRFEHAICRYDEEELICRAFAILGIPPPPADKARMCAEAIVKAGDLIAEVVSALSPNGDAVREQQARVAEILVMISAPKVEPTLAQVKDDKQLGRSLCLASVQQRASVEIHAGIGAIYHVVVGDTLVSRLAPINGPGMDRRRDYLVSVVETSRDAMERTFS